MTKKIIILSFVLILVASAYYGSRVAVTEQIPLLDSVRSASSIVFAIFGAWMAIVYPRSVASLGARVAETRLAALKEVENILVPMIMSTIILFVSMLLTVAGPVIRKMDVSDEWRSVVWGGHYSIVVALFLAQFAILFNFFGPVVVDYRRMWAQHRDRYEKEKRGSLRQKREKRI